MPKKREGKDQQDLDYGKTYGKKGSNDPDKEFEGDKQVADDFQEMFGPVGIPPFSILT